MRCRSARAELDRGQIPCRRLRVVDDVAQQSSVWAAGEAGALLGSEVNAFGILWGAGWGKFQRTGNDEASTGFAPRRLLAKTLRICLMEHLKERVIDVDAGHQLGPRPRCRAEREEPKCDGALGRRLLAEGHLALDAAIDDEANQHPDAKHDKQGESGQG